MGNLGRKEVDIPDYDIQMPKDIDRTTRGFMEAAVVVWVYKIVLDTGSLPTTGATLPSSVGTLTVTYLEPALYWVNKA